MTVLYIAYIKKEKKIGKINMRKVTTSRKRKTHNGRWKPRLISVCECV